MNDASGSRFAPIAGLICLGFFSGVGAAANANTDATPPAPWHYRLYVDAGYALSDNRPANGDWRSKSTTYKLDDLELNLVMGNLRKEALPGSRWGVELGLQTGVDSEGLRLEPPPPAPQATDNADTWRHLYRANFSYRFGAERGLRLKAGLIESYLGYESFLAIDNPNYTRGYLTDTLPYFMLGLEAVWYVSEEVDLSLYLISGYDYLTRPNHSASPGLKVAWKISPRITLKQNLYYGPDQEETQIEFWRFVSDTNVEWKRERFLLAAQADLGTEKQANPSDQPRQVWASGALWARWQLTRRWSVALRPEFYWDPDGLITGARQFIGAYTGTVKYRFSPRHHRLVGALEVRYDRSNGDQGGFYEGPDNLLVPGQSLVIFGFNWSFDR